MSIQVLSYIQSNPLFNNLSQKSQLSNSNIESLFNSISTSGNELFEEENEVKLNSFMLIIQAQLINILESFLSNKQSSNASDDTSATTTAAVSSNNATTSASTSEDTATTTSSTDNSSKSKKSSSESTQATSFHLSNVVYEIDATTNRIDILNTRIAKNTAKKQEIKPKVDVLYKEMQELKKQYDKNRNDAELSAKYEAKKTEYNKLANNELASISGKIRTDSKELAEAKESLAELKTLKAKYQSKL